MYKSEFLIEITINKASAVNRNLIRAHTDNI